jgi:hypothetical protein
LGNRPFFTSWALSFQFLDFYGWRSSNNCREKGGHGKKAWTALIPGKRIARYVFVNFQTNSSRYFFNRFFIFEMVVADCCLL